jgi:hypothetical protein
VSLEPYLTGRVREDFDAWCEATRARFMPPLSFSEVRKGVRALSSLYVERRDEGRLAARALDGQGKRAAFACYYAPLHFLATWHAAETLAEPVERVIDLGCGSGATGAACARRLGAAPVLGVDRSGWALGEARRTWRAFGLAGRSRRGALPGALPRTRPGDLLCAGWAINELEEEPREELLEGLRAAAARGVRLLVIEPLAGAASPWWEAWRPRFAEVGVESRPLKRSLALPAWIARMDKAAGLSHQPLGARILRSAA